MYYLVLMGQAFEDAATSQNSFEELEQAKEAALLRFGPKQRYLICDERGGVHLIGITPNYSEVSQ